MSAIVTQQDGYGWNLGSSITTAGDVHGIYFTGFTGASASVNAMDKTIYVDASTFAPQRIDKIFRVQAVTHVNSIDSASAVIFYDWSFNVKITNLLDVAPITINYRIADLFSVGDQGMDRGSVVNYLDVHVTGYAITDVNVEFSGLTVATNPFTAGEGGTAGDIIQCVYEMNEAGI